MPAKVGQARKTTAAQTKKSSASSNKASSSSRASSSKSVSTQQRTPNVDSFVKSTPRPDPGTYSRPASSNPGVRREKEQAQQAKAQEKGFVEKAGEAVTSALSTTCEVVKDATVAILKGGAIVEGVYD